MRNALALFVALTLGGCASCAGSPGQIVEARADKGFVTEAATLFVSTARGIERIGLNGSDQRVVFARREAMSWSILDVSFDFRTFLLQTSDTELFVGDVSSGTVRSVPATGHRVSTARFSPDAKRFAAARHSNFNVPNAKEDDTLYIVDTATLSSEEIRPATESWPSTIRWANDESGLWVKMNWEGPPQWVTLADKTRHFGVASPPVPIDDARHPGAASCAESVVTGKWSTTLRMVEGPPRTDGSDARDAGGRVIVELRGRKRGFHDYQADFHSPTLSPGCNFVVFGFHQAVWVADVRGGAAAPVLEGADVLFFAPPAR